MPESLTKDQIFISKLTDIILANIGKEEFGVRELAHESGISLYRLGRRLHSINKKTISQFIREVRLQKALEMLHNEELTASEVAYRVGFGSPTYFNKSFHDFFGFSPGQARRKSNEIPVEDPASNNEGLRSKVKTRPVTKILKFSWLMAAGIVLLTIAYLVKENVFKADALKRLGGSSEKLSVAVMPFQNLTNDTTWNKWQVGIQQRLVAYLSESGELRVRNPDNIRTVLEHQGITESGSFPSSVAGRVSDKLSADIYIYGGIQQAGQTMNLNAQLTDTKTREVIKSFEISGPFKDEVVFDLTDSLRKKITDFLIMSKLIEGNIYFKHGLYKPPKSAEALRYFFYGTNARKKGDNQGAERWYLKALEADSNFTAAAFSLENTYAYDGKPEESLKWLIKDYKARDRMCYFDQVYASWAYAYTFESDEKQIGYLNQLKEIDDESINSHWLLGLTYFQKEQYDKAIPGLKRSNEIATRWFGKENYKDVSNYCYLGIAYIKAGQLKNARKLYRFAERYIPEHPLIITGKAVLAFSENDTVDAKREIGRYISFQKKNSSTEADIAWGVGDIYHEAGMNDTAEAYYRKALSLDPGNTDIMNGLADFFMETSRNLAEVPELMDRVMPSAGNKVDFYRFLNKKGWAIYKQGRIMEALEILQKAYDEAPFKEYSLKYRLEEVIKAAQEQKIL